MEATLKAPVSFTDSAKNEIKRLMGVEDFDQAKKLRVGVKGGGCSGMTYVLNFDTLKDNDEVFELDGISFMIDKAHGIYLVGMEIDWEGGLNSSGAKIFEKVINTQRFCFESGPRLPPFEGEAGRGAGAARTGSAWVTDCRLCWPRLLKVLVSCEL